VIRLRLIALVALSTMADVAAAPMPLPSNDLVGCGG
jgi:hypothetical protein